MSSDEKALIDAILKLGDNKKIKKIISKLMSTGDISYKIAAAVFDKLPEEKEDISRAKTITPEPEYSDPPEYDRCGNRMTKDEVKKRNERLEQIKQEKDMKRRAEEEWARRRRENNDGCGRSIDPCGGGFKRSYDPCGSSSSYC